MADCRTGEIASLDHFHRTLSPDEVERFVQPVDLGTLNPFARVTLEKTGRAKIGRNDPCFCGSGKRFKRCCMEIPKIAADVSESIAGC